MKIKKIKYKWLNKSSIFFIAILSSMCFSCANKHYSAKPAQEEMIDDVLSKMPDIEVFPDYDYLHPKGDSICERIINTGTEIVPYLIEKITDTTQTKVSITDDMNYRVGDAAIFLIEAICAFNSNMASSFLSLREIIRDNFLNEKHKPFFFLQEYRSIFLFNSEKENYENRKKLQLLLKEKLVTFETKKRINRKYKPHHPLKKLNKATV